jgi:hypothetical protein
MANNIFFAKGSPTKFTKISYANIPQYVSKFMDLFLFKDTIEDWEEDVDYFQPWIGSDAVRNQFVSNFSPIIVRMWTVDNVFVIDQPVEAVIEDADRPGYFIYNMDFDLNSYPVGFYYFTLDCGNSQLIFVSEPFEIKAKSTDTLLLEFDNPTPREDLVFYYANGTKLFSPSLRVPGRLKYLGTESFDTLYFDQVRNSELLKSVVYDTYTFILGRPEGVPPWKMKKVGRIFAMRNVRCDGLLISKIVENAKFERLEVDEYPMQGWKLEVCEKLNHASNQYTTTAPVVGLNSMMAIVETKGFGIEDQGGNFLEIEQVI